MRSPADPVERGRPAGDNSPTVRTPGRGVDPVPGAGPNPGRPDDPEPPTVAVPASTAPAVGDPSDSEATQAIRLPNLPPSGVPATPGNAAGDATTQAIRRPDVPPVAAPVPDDNAAGSGGGDPAGAGTELLAAPDSPPPPDPGPGGSTRAHPRRRRILLVAAAVIGLFALLYGGDLALGAGKVPRGVLVAGIPVGGLSLADAERELRGQIDPRAAAPIPVTAGEARSEIDPKAAGLSVDWPATMDRAGDPPLNPLTRISSFFTQREVGVASSVDTEALDSALAGLGPIVDRPPVEGSVKFEGTTPTPVLPVPGQQLDVPRAKSVLQREWALGRPIPLPMNVVPPITTADDVTEAIEKVATPAVSAPVTVTGEGGVEGTLTPEAITGVLGFRPDPSGLVPEINIEAAIEALEPQLAPSETPGRDAALDFSSGRPVVTPSKDGRGIDYAATLKALLPVLTGTGERKITAIYADQPAELTTEELNNLGITGVIGEFTTRGFAPDSGKNIRRAAQVINGTIVEPGETFSLNGATEPRSTANGYVEAGIISDGHASRGVGGGVSQVATTLYNAAYFAGMTDVEHKEHSFYISRYPPGREATVFDDKIDMKFRNDNPTGILIQTAWTPQSITVRLFGTKRYEVTSTPGPRTNPTEPQKVTIGDGEPCAESDGAPGFTVTDTRTLREISTGKVRSETRTVKYNPSPIVRCEDDD
jgi:vancomycin resistance protein YoaR